jgi:hypothetical protein
VNGGGGPYREEFTAAALADNDGVVVPIRAFRNATGPVIGSGVIHVDDLGLTADIRLDDSPAAQRFRAAIAGAQTLSILEEPLRIIPLEHWLRYADVATVHQARLLAHVRISGRRLAAIATVPLERLVAALTRRIR